jgi:putative transposase
VYRSLGLNLPRRTKRRPPRRALQILEAPATLNRVWALDFMHDRLYGTGRPFRTLNVVDEANREGLAIEVGTSIPASRVVRVMGQLEEMYGLPAAVRVDNGPEFLAEAFQSWCADHGIEIRFIQPGKPNQNAFVERFKKSYRDEILDAYLFERIEEVQRLTDQWLLDLQRYRPRDALGGVPPTRYMPRPTAPELSTFEVCP